MNKRHSKRLAGLLPKPAKVFSWKLRDIKDLDKLELIYICNQWHEFIPMCTMIREYGEFEFFRDLLIYLNHNFSGQKQKELMVHSHYEHFQDIYFNKYNIEIA